MKKIIVIGGPTATGKTDLALKIAREVNGEIINADSRQIYRYLDIGTNKNPLAINDEQLVINNYSYPIHEDAGVKFHLFSFLEPNQQFNLYDYKKLAESAIEDVISRGKVPILVGGTGLYIDSIVKNYKLKNRNYKDRALLNKLTVEDLQERLIRVNKKVFDALNESDKKNPRRLTRLIEKGEEIVEEQDFETQESSYDFIFLYPKYDWEKLKVKIAKRVEEMFEAGLVDETKEILENGYLADSPALQTMGYKECVMFLRGVITKEKALELTKIAHRKYAKRQKTWFEGTGRGYNLVRVNGSQINKTLTQIKKWLAS